MKEKLIKNRAWIELDLENLEHNVNEIKRVIPKKTKIMAIVKANAYGHGIVEVSKKLSEIGINDFAVASLDEAITLRENNIIGNILILGYTNLDNIDEIIKYDLIQTVVDEDYANNLLKLNVNSKIKVHLKVNTGMNRIGINPNNIEFIKNLYSQEQLDVLGIFSHFSVADSNKADDIEFTHKQIDIFNNVIDSLKSANIDVGNTHLQSSYGILNYPELKYDYVRPGIIMYGNDNVLDVNSKIKLDLKPVLSLKATITSVKEIDKDSYVSYGRTYHSNEKEKIASVSIGYADGYPRNLSGKHVCVLVNDEYAEVIGRICMDQLIINVSHIDNVKPGDIVTLIGNDEKISVETLSDLSNTITNELLSRLGSRLKRLIKK